MFRGVNLPVWEGKVKIDAIKFWRDSPRIATTKRVLEQEKGDRKLTEEEFFEFMVASRDVQLKPLVNDILKNGLRAPLVFGFDGKLLDGNRRYCAICWIVKSAPEEILVDLGLQTVNAWILSPEDSEELGQTIAIWSNYFDSCKLTWPEHALAESFVSAHESGKTPQEIAEMYDLPKFKINEVIHTQEIISEFVSFATEPPDTARWYGGGLGISVQAAEAVVAEKYQTFKEISFAYEYPIKYDLKFRSQLFRWIYEGKFENIAQLRLAYLIWENPEARAAIMQSDPDAAANARAILEYDISRVRSAAELHERINNIAYFLEKLKVSELKSIPKSSIEQLSQISQTVAVMCSSISSDN